MEDRSSENPVAIGRRGIKSMHDRLMLGAATGIANKGAIARKFRETSFVKLDGVEDRVHAGPAHRLDKHEIVAGHLEAMLTAAAVRWTCRNRSCR